MTQTLLNVIADLELSLAAAVSVGATTATLNTAVDGNGVAIPAGKYGFTIDGDTSAKEFIICDLSGTALTNIQSVTVQGATSSGFANYHRIGAVVTITDWVILKRIINNLNGTTGFNSATPLNYDAEPSYADPLAIPTVQFVLDTASGGTVTFDRQIIAGDAGENVSAGDWVYFDTSDGEWYLTDADVTAKSLNVRIGKAIGAGTNGNPISGGIFVSGTETVGTYVAGTTYYLSNTAGALSTSAGTNSVVVGVGDANGDLILRVPTPNQVDAMQGSSGTPSSTNTYVTTNDVSSTGASGKIVRANGTKLPTALYGATKKIVASGAVTNVGDNSTTETNVFSETVPGGFLVGNNAIRVRIYVSEFTTGNSANDDVTLRFKYGATTLTSFTIDNAATTNTGLNGVIEAVLFGTGDSSQLGVVTTLLSTDKLNASTSGLGKVVYNLVSGTSTEDSTADKTLAFSVQWANATSANDFIVTGYTVELIS